MQWLCDAQIQNDRRRIILSSIIKIYNSTAESLIIMSIDSLDPGKHRRITKIEKDTDFYLPIDLVYAHANSPIFISVER